MAYKIVKAGVRHGRDEQVSVSGLNSLCRAGRALISLSSALFVKPVRPSDKKTIPPALLEFHSVEICLTNFAFALNDEVLNIAKQVCARSYRSRTRRSSKPRIRGVLGLKQSDGYNDSAATVRYQYAKPSDADRDNGQHCDKPGTHYGDGNGSERQRLPASLCHRCWVQPALQLRLLLEYGPGQQRGMRRIPDSGPEWVY